MIDLVADGDCVEVREGVLVDETCPRMKSLCTTIVKGVLAESTIPITKRVLTVFLAKLTRVGPATVTRELSSSTLTNVGLLASKTMYSGSPTLG